MPSSGITNSLLRLDGIVTSLPPPFELRRSDPDFAVLELGADIEIPSWQTLVKHAVASYRAVVQEAQRGGATAVLFVEYAAPAPLRLDPDFLRMLVDADIALELFHGDG